LENMSLFVLLAIESQLDYLIDTSAEIFTTELLAGLDEIIETLVKEQEITRAEEQIAILQVLEEQALEIPPVVEAIVIPPTPEQPTYNDTPIPNPDLYGDDTNAPPVPDTGLTDEEPEEVPYEPAPTPTPTPPQLPPPSPAALTLLNSVAIDYTSQTTEIPFQETHVFSNIYIQEKSSGYKKRHFDF